MDDLIERVARAIIAAHKEIWPGSWPAIPEAKQLARAAIAECFKWRPIEEYDALTKKPDNCVFWMAKDTNNRRADLSLSAGITVERNRGSRKITHWLPLPESMKEGK